MVQHFCTHYSIYTHIKVFHCTKKMESTNNQTPPNKASLYPSQTNDILLLWSWKQIRIYSCYQDLDITPWRWVKSNFLKREKLKLKETITSVQKAKLYAYHPIIIKAGFITTSGSLFCQARDPTEISLKVWQIQLLSGAIPLFAGIPSTCTPSPKPGAIRNTKFVMHLQKQSSTITHDCIIQPSAPCDSIQKFIILSYLTHILPKKGSHQSRVNFPAKVI